MIISYIIDFFKTNWPLYFILIIDVFTEYDNLTIIKEINNEEIFYKKVFDSYLFNFIYILMPFYNIGIKIAQNKINKQINFTNMIKLNLLLISINLKAERDLNPCNFAFFTKGSLSSRCWLFFSPHL